MKSSNYIYHNRKQLFFLLLPLLCGFSISAQNSLMKFGSINQKEVDYKQCDFDPEAEAVVFFDSGSTRFEDTDEGFNVVFTRFTRIKILKENGKKWAQVEIPLYVSNNIYETVQNLKATAYNMDENGNFNSTALDPNQCHTEKLNDRWVIKKFAIPNVKAGTIIEYQYQLYSQHVFNLRDWEFQGKIPVIYSEYNVSMIPFYEYTYSLQGASKFDDYSHEESSYERNFASVKFRDLTHHFAMYNIPAFRDEEFISSMNDYVMKLDFQLSKINYPDGRKKDIITTWPAMKEDLVKDDNFGKYQIKCMKMAEKLINVKSLTLKPAKERFDSVISFVKQNFRWDKTYRMYATKSPSKLLTDKTGTSAELNLLACGLLNAVGINSSPVIISTRNNGKINTQYPFYDSFNNVVICTQPDSATIITDATLPEVDNNRLPTNDINGLGLIIDKNAKVQWAILKTNFPSVERTSIKMNVSPEQTVAAINVCADEYFNLRYRNEAGNDKALVQKRFISKNYEVNDSTIKIPDYDNKMNYRYLYQAEMKTEQMNNKIYLSPFCHELFYDNPLKQKTRSYPIDMIFRQQRIYTSEISIPKGYKISYMPLGKELDDDKVALKFSINKEENHIRAYLDFQFKKPEYSPSDYNALKDFFNEIIAKANEKIVLEKIQ